MSFVVAGGTGFIGQALVDRLARRGHGVTIVTRRRDPPRMETGLKSVAWSLDTGPELVRAVEEAETVVNLAGEPVVGKRWSPMQKEAILESRVRSTRLLVQAIAKSRKKPLAFVSASAVGFYGDRGNETLDEKSLGGVGFLAETCRRWEEEALQAEKLGVRTVLLRIGVVLGKGGGALDKMLGPFRLGLGGPIGNGGQWMSWIHLNDLVRLIEWAAAQNSVSGPLNGTAPHPVLMKDFARALGKALGKPAFFPVPGFLLKIALGEAAGLLLASQKVLPRKAAGAGFAHDFPNLDGALSDLLS